MSSSYSLEGQGETETWFAHFHTHSALLGNSRPGGECADSAWQGNTVGPALADALDDMYDGMWVQGVGGPYAAKTLDNLLPLGTTQEAIDEAKRLFSVAHDKCSDSVVLTGGYRCVEQVSWILPACWRLTKSPFSQGAAVVAAALTQLASESDIQDQVAGAVLFGYPLDHQNDGRIPDFPEEKTQMYCNTTDLICHGILIILPAHGFYENDASTKAPDFLRGRVDAADDGGWWRN